MFLQLSEIYRLPMSLFGASLCLSVFQVFELQAGLTVIDSEGVFHPLLPIIPSFSTAVYGKQLHLPAFWWDTHTHTCGIVGKEFGWVEGNKYPVISWESECVNESH